MIGHINATLEGLNTIRVSQMEATLSKQYYQHQDLYNSAAYMSLATVSEFGYSMNILSNLSMVIISYAFILIINDALAGQVGIATSQYLFLGRMLVSGVGRWDALEILMTSNERVLEYTEIGSEDKSGKKINEWPKGGKIEYQEMNLRYSPASKRVLKDISFVIHPMEKIGLVGRTGSGKSCIISSLFRMYDYKGTITIDDVNIQEVDVEHLRLKISIIPQDPVLFSGIIRSNFDPNCEYPEASAKNSSCAWLERLFATTSLATANVDPHTDSLIQRSIRRKFRGCTGITMRTMDSDKALVIDSGVAVE